MSYGISNATVTDRPAKFGVAETVRVSTCVCSASAAAFWAGATEAGRTNAISSPVGIVKKKRKKKDRESVCVYLKKQR
jgi:hypothetical protein